MSGNGHMSEEFVEDFPTQALPPAGMKQQNFNINAKLNALSLWMGILNARLLALLAIIGALAIFGVAISYPTNLTLTAASLYCMGVLWPIMWLFSRKG